MPPTMYICVESMALYDVSVLKKNEISFFKLAFWVPQYYSIGYDLQLENIVSGSSVRDFLLNKCIFH